jgi:mono/diheme cytochrome c family protein
LKKRTKKLLILGRVLEDGRVTRSKSFLLLFFKKEVLAFSVLCFAALALRARADIEPLPIAAAGAHIDGDLVTRGAYLAHMADCAACHLGAGGALSGGRPITTPFGKIYAPNITPDKATGIGAYSDDEWVAALREGVARDGTHLYPAMPYTSYRLMTRDDALAIKAYLMTQPSVHAEATPAAMRFPFNIRFLMVFWNWLNSPGHTFAQEASHDAAWNRGAYLAEALGHCQQCHTPRNIIQGLKSSKAYAGAVQQGWLAYNVTSDTSGIGAWQAHDIAAYLSTGRADGHGVAAGPMAEAVSYSLRYLTPADADALATYVKSLPARPAAEVPSASPSGTAARGDALGQAIFAGACASCHRADGAGVESAYAALLGDQSVGDPQGRNLLQMLLHGGAITTRNGAAGMPAFAGAYSDAELAAVANFTIQQLSHVQGQVSAEQVAHARQSTGG